MDLYSFLGGILFGLLLGFSLGSSMKVGKLREEFRSIVKEMAAKVKDLGPDEAWYLEMSIGREKRGDDDEGDDGTTEPIVPEAYEQEWSRN